jgi:hypothetical protein
MSPLAKLQSQIVDIPLFGSIPAGMRRFLSRLAVTTKAKRKKVELFL